MRKFAFLAVFLTLALSLTSCLNLTFNYFGETAPKADSYETKPAEITDGETEEEIEPDTEPVTEPDTESAPLPETELQTEQETTADTDTTEETDKANDCEETEIPTLSLWIDDLTSPISANKTATLVAFGKPNTVYSIAVYYSTTISNAKGLESKLSDDNGRVEWNWKIGGSVKTGRYKIVVSGGDESLETEIQIHGN